MDDELFDTPRVWIVTREGNDFFEILMVCDNWDAANQYADTLDDDCWGDVCVTEHALRKGRWR